MFDVFEALARRTAGIAKKKNEIAQKKEKAVKELREAKIMAEKAITSGDAEAYAEAEANVKRLKLVIEGCDKIAGNYDKKLSEEEASVMWSEYMKSYNPQMKKLIDEYESLKQKLFDKGIECALYQNRALRVRGELSGAMEKNGIRQIDNTAGFEDMNYLNADDFGEFFNQGSRANATNWGALATCLKHRLYSPELDK